jgi:hypothetical protein
MTEQITAADARPPPAPTQTSRLFILEHDAPAWKRAVEQINMEQT